MKHLRHPFYSLLIAGIFTSVSSSGTTIANTTATYDIRNTGRPQSVGLVLSGGGAKGIAHIGVISTAFLMPPPRL